MINIIMIPEWKILDLVDLVRQRYPAWQDAADADFVADELTPKRALSTLAADTIGQAAIDELLGDGEYEEIIARLELLTRRTNLLWRQVPLKGDTAVFHPSLRPQLDLPTLCVQFRNLLHGDRPSPQRLQTFSDYLDGQQLPNKWPLPTYLLFMVHPKSDIFVRPRAMSWFLKFVGDGGAVRGKPDGGLYAYIQQQAQALLLLLAPYDISDMIGVQSIIWIGMRESRARLGGLDPEAQVALDVPKSTPPKVEMTETAVLQESPPAYQAISAIQPAHPLPNIAQQTGHDEATLQQWVAAIERKGQAIFYGPPGTGKTFLAQQMAHHLVGGGDGFQELIQFHPTYAYEDFVQGIRPRNETDGTLRYELVNGRFLTFCQQAAQRNGRCVLIIDEINRANLAAVFGELMYLLEYREATIPLAAGGRFSIPANVRIIGTMNTADRSIALVDHALRRRFAFIHLPPNYAILHHYHAQTGYDATKLEALLRRLNAQIDDPHYQLGITFFLQPNLASQLASIWQMEIEPYLEEYFFDQPDLVNQFRWGQVKEELG